MARPRVFQTWDERCSTLKLQGSPLALSSDSYRSPVEVESSESRKSSGMFVFCLLETFFSFLFCVRMTRHDGMTADWGLK